MLLSKTVKVRWNGYTRKWYEDKGYIWNKQNDLFECKIEDIMETSTIKILIKCDYCGEEFMKSYRKYIKGRKTIKKDCCGNHRCINRKTAECNLINYGVENNNQRPEVKHKGKATKKTSFQKIKKDFDDKSLILLSPYSDYENDRSELKFICKKHEHKGVQFTSYSNVKRNKHCCKYGGDEANTNALRIDGVEVYNKFIEKGLVPLFYPSDYNDNSQNLPYKCPNHLNEGIQYRSYSTLLVSEGCAICAKERCANALKLDMHIVIEEFSKKGLTLLSKEYRNKDEKLEYECNEHRGYVQMIRFGSLKKTKIPCRICREEKYLTNLSSKVRATLGWWKKYSKKVFSNTCILTGIKGDIEVHHQKQLDTIIKEALVELNLELSDKYDGRDLIRIKEKVTKMHKKLPIGICLNKDLHILFHIKYGKKECEKCDFDEFIERYFMGEFDVELREELKSINSKRSLEEVKKLASFYYVEN